MARERRLLGSVSRSLARSCAKCERDGARAEMAGTKGVVGVHTAVVEATVGSAADAAG